jgi:aminotransferase
MSDRRSDRIRFLEQSDIRRMSRECARHDGINLGQGICPLPSPPEVLDGAAEAIREDKSTYSAFEGVPELREALAEKFAADNGMEVDPDSEVVVTVGSTGAFACAVQGLFDPGDEFVLLEPYYGYHLNAIRGGGCEARFVTLEPPEWEIRREALEEAITEDTRAIVVNTPTNPSGKVFGRGELETVAGVCRDHDLIAVTDEIYEYFLYDDHEHVSLATLPGMRERTVTISGFSKTFAVTGWRLGYAAGPEELMEPIGLVNDIHYVCAPTPLQHGVARAMERLSDAYYEEMAAEFEKRRDFICPVLDEVGLTPYVPDGAYYVLADVSGLGYGDDREAAMHILEEAGVASVPGTAFHAGEEATDLVRFCYAQDWETLEAAARALEDDLHL